MLLAMILPFSWQLPAHAATINETKEETADRPAAVLSLPCGEDRALPSLCPGGMVFGIHVRTPGVLIVGLCDLGEGAKESPAAQAGLRVGDIITEIDGHAVHSANDLLALLRTCNGDRIAVVYRRGDETRQAQLQPHYAVNENTHRIGVRVKDSAAGLGTVTYVDPRTGEFGGLGHGICDGESGALLPVQRGLTTGAVVRSVVPGKAGTPGELRGTLLAQKTGTLIANTPCGVFGVFAGIPITPEAALPVAPAAQVHAGEAYIWSTVDGGAPVRYAVTLSDLHPGTDSKNFTVHVTDPVLLQKTGGIVQGMSGSPIIQDGKLVGAVTHVMINDPATGYGIFLENMLRAADDSMRQIGKQAS